MPEKVAIIGAGIAGIAAAIRLACKGCNVDVYEKNDAAGGKMSEFRQEGFRFDAGPSLFTLPGLIDDLFEVADEKASASIDYKKLDLVCRYFYNDGMVIDAHGEPEAFMAELQQKAGEDPTKTGKYLDDSRRLFDLTNPVFINHSLHLIKNYFSKDFLKAFFSLHKLKPFTTLHRLNESAFSHPNTIQLFDRFATYNGSDPYKSPATLRVIPHLEHNLGAYFPEGGMYRIVSSLVALAERLGVKFHYHCDVGEILLAGQRSGKISRRAMGSGRRVTGLRVNGDTVTGYDAVITDLDIYFVYKKLLKNIPFPEKWFRHERSTSALIFYWGMKVQTPVLDVHNILFAGDYRQEFRSLFELKTIHDDPTVYIFITSKLVNQDAPEGCENWFVMINAPADSGQDWDRLIKKARLIIEDKIRRVVGVDVGGCRMFEQVLDPGGIERKTASFMGSLYGNSSNSMWAAFQRHPNFSVIRGLYHVGGSVHPGGGIPLCLSSAKIVAEMISNNSI